MDSYPPGKEKGAPLTASGLHAFLRLHVSIKQSSSGHCGQQTPLPNLALATQDRCTNKQGLMHLTCAGRLTAILKIPAIPLKATLPEARISVPYRLVSFRVPTTGTYLCIYTLSSVSHPRPKGYSSKRAAGAAPPVACCRP